MRDAGIVTENLAAALGEFHPFHACAREEIADLVASRQACQHQEAGVPKSGSEAFSSPFLAYVSAPEEVVDDAPVQHILLHGPAGSGKRNLAGALQACLKGRIDVHLRETDEPSNFQNGIVVWIARDGVIPKHLPPRTPKVRVRSLSSTEKRRLVALMIDAACPMYGLDSSEFHRDDIMDVLLRGGASEAGVLGATQRLHKLCRRRARLRQESVPHEVDLAWAAGVLGPDAHPQDPIPVRVPAGCVFAPVVSSLGGALAQVEAFANPGKGRLTVTGAGSQAELSVRVARSRCLAMASQLGFSVETLRDMDWHIHVAGPEGPKDGVSLGWPVVVAMASHLTDIAVDARFAFTGELALTGEIRSVGMVEEKFLACEREAFKRFWIPSANLGDLAGLDSLALGECEPFPVANDLTGLRQLGLVSRT